jgi:4-aminobutyrate aminotransferase
LGALVGRREVMSLPGGSHATTFGGSPVALAAASDTLDLLKDGLMDNARVLGEYILGRFREFMDRYELIGDVRGLGLMIGVELVRDRRTREPAKKELNRIISNCFKNGVLVIGAGASAIRIAPPLVITREQVDEALDVIEREIRRVDAELDR